jgi:hypothetical protein
MAEKSQSSILRNAIASKAIMRFGKALIKLPVRLLGCIWKKVATKRTSIKASQGKKSIANRKKRVKRNSRLLSAK